MKKVTLLFALIAFIGFGSAFTGTKSNQIFAQSFELVYSDTLLSTPDETIDELMGHMNIKNNSSDTISVLVKLIFDKYTLGHEAAICTYYCFDYVSQEWITPEAFKLAPNLTTTEMITGSPFGLGISVHCKPHEVAGITKVTYRFYDENNPSDFLDVPVKFAFGSTSVEDNVSQNYLAAYPNPTNSILSVYSETISINNISIFSITGEKVFTENNIGINYKTLDLSRLAKGKYLMQVNLEDGTSKFESVIVE